MMSGPHSFFAPLRDNPPLADGIWHARNWYPGPKPIWSRGQTASLAFDMQRFPAPVPLVMRLCIFNAQPQTPRRLCLSVPGQPDAAYHVATDVPITVLTQTPTALDSADFGMMALTLDRLRSPAQIGLSTDDRLLGLHIVSVMSEASILSMPLDIANCGAAQPILVHGWDAIEPGLGAWSLGREARLVLPGYLRTQCAGHLCLETDVLGRPEGTPPLQVDVFCDGISVAKWQFPGDPPSRLTFPVTNWSENTDMTLTFRLNNVRSPAELGLSTDSRPLGLLLRRLHVQDAPKVEPTSEDCAVSAG